MEPILGYSSDSTALIQQVFRSLNYSFYPLKTSLIQLFLVFGVFVFHIEVEKSLSVRKYLEIFRKRVTYSKSLCTYRTPLPFYNKCIALGHTNACFSSHVTQIIGSHLSSPGHSPGEQQEGLTRRSSLEQSFPSGVPEGFLVPTVQNLWRKTLDMRYERGANKHPLLGNSHSCPSRPGRCCALPSLTNVQTTVQRHCPEQVVWTLGRRGRSSRSFHLGP